jgi:stage V sporulation protein G
LRTDTDFLPFAPVCRARGLRRRAYFAERFYVKERRSWAKMNITEVRIRLVKRDEGKMKAIASITIDDCFVVHDIKIIQGNKTDDNYFIAMPSKKTPDGEFKDIVHPLNSATRELISRLVLAEFEKEAAKTAQESEAAEQENGA